MTALAIGLMTAAIVWATAYQLGSGRGGVFAVTTAAQQISMVTTSGIDGAESYAVCISVQNLGSSTVFVAHDCANATLFNKAVADNEAIQLSEQEYFNFHGTRLTSIWAKTTNGTTSIKIGAY